MSDDSYAPLLAEVDQSMLIKVRMYLNLCLHTHDDFVIKIRAAAAGGGRGVIVLVVCTQSHGDVITRCYDVCL